MYVKGPHTKPSHANPAHIAIVAVIPILLSSGKMNEVAMDNKND